MDIVGRAIDRIDEPGRGSIVVAGHAVLLADDLMVGEALRDRLAGEPLDRQVGLGNPVRRPLLRRDLVSTRPLGDDPLHRANRDLVHERGAGVELGVGQHLSDRTRR